MSGGLPPELDRAVARPVRLTGPGEAVLAAAVLSALEAAVFGTWLYETARRSQQTAARMRSEAVRTAAVVTSIVRIGARGSWIGYRFQVAGRAYVGSFSADQGRSPSYRIGSKIQIAYLPSRPERNWPEGREPEGMPVSLGPLVAAVSLGVAAGLLLWLRAQRRLLEEGRAASPQ
ncbi:MAG: DUF3592 domain-containing protein [Bryobacteraceae bacterium]